MADQVGQYIDDYRLIRPLGTGSFGEVYVGEHLVDQTLVAVKMLSLDQENLKEFVKETSTTLRLKHPHIIRLLAFGISADDIPYLIMDYAPNGTLRQRHPKGTRLPLDTIVSYLLPLASALQYAHDSRVIHCDVKPENVLIGLNGEILLSDFGIAVIAPIEQSLRTHNLGGTVPYMAPEQIRGKPLPASDQYALGVMAYEWLCGVRPFQGTMWEILNHHQSNQPPLLREKLPNLPLMAEEIILKALAKDPQERFARVLDFALALEQVTRVGSPSSLSLPPVLPSTDTSQLVSRQDKSTILGRGDHFLPQDLLSRQQTLVQKHNAGLHSEDYPQTSKKLLGNTTKQPNRLLLRFVVPPLAFILGLSIFAIGFMSYKNLQLDIQQWQNPEAATATATAILHQRYAQATSGPPVFADSLRDNSIGYKWAEDGNCFFKEGAYHTRAQPHYYQYCNAAEFPLLHDFAFQTKIIILNGNGGGFDFRINNNYGYLFYISQDGTYTIIRDDDQNFIILHHDFSPTIDTGLGKSNLVAVLAHGNAFDLYVNNQYMTSFNDNTYSQGYVECLAVSLSNNLADVAFQDAKAWTR